jgi:toxin ParE1/3/4
MTHAVLFSPEAQEDLLTLQKYIAQHSGSKRAFSYVERVTDYCQSFSTFPERGSQRGDLRPGLRVIGFASRITIAFHIRKQSSSTASSMVAAPSKTNVRPRATLTHYRLSQFTFFCTI